MFNNMSPSFWRLEIFKAINHASLLLFLTFFSCCVQGKKEDRITGQLVCSLLKASLIGVRRQNWRSLRSYVWHEIIYFIFMLIDSQAHRQQEFRLIIDLVYSKIILFGQRLGSAAHQGLVYHMSSFSSEPGCHLPTVRRQCASKISFHFSSWLAYLLDQ